MKNAAQPGTVLVRRVVDVDVGTLTTSETHPHHFPHHSGGTAGNARQRLGSDFSVFLWIGVRPKRPETGLVDLAQVDVESSNLFSRSK